MTELEISQQLGIVVEPEKNRVTPTPDLQEDLFMVTYALTELLTQKQSYGSVNPDLWLEFIPWHSLN